MGVDFVVFSKNRACQLDLLLQSADAMLDERDAHSFTVLYKADDPEFEAGYRLASSRHAGVTFLGDSKDSDVNEQMLDVFSAGSGKYCSILVDDDLFVRTISMTDGPFRVLDRDASVSAISTRLHPKIDFCHPLGLKVAPSRVNRNGVFSWEEERDTLSAALRRVFGQPARGGGDWGCKMSMDGNIYRRQDMLGCLGGISGVRSVGYLEPALASNPIPGPNGVCYRSARLVNVPLNRVDNSEFNYPSMGESAAMINARYLAGECIEGFDFPAVPAFRSCHVEANPVWTRAASGSRRPRPELEIARA